MDHILGPKKDKVSMPYETERTFLDCNGNLVQYFEDCFFAKTSIIMPGARSFITLYSSTANI